MVIGESTIVFEGRKRYYVEDLTKRDFTLECATPHILKLDDYEIQENTWVEMIRNITAYLISTSNKSKEDIISFKTDWSKTNIFSPTQRTNFKQLDDDLFVNCNHTALHSCWLIQDLMDFFGIDKSKVYFLIHRAPYAEPKDAKAYFKNKFKEEFPVFLKERYEKSEIDAQKIISNIENYMDPILKTISKSYDSFMLFEDTTSLWNYIKKFSEKINGNPRYTDKTKRTMERYLSYLNEFYKI